MSNPYAPPATRENVPEQPPNKNTILRRLGALSLGYVAGRALIDPFPDLASALGGAAIMGACVYGFLRGGRKFHLGIALFMAAGLCAIIYFTNEWIDHRNRPPSHRWLVLARDAAPHTIALVCASALYFRARRSSIATAADDSSQTTEREETPSP